MYSCSSKFKPENLYKIFFIILRAYYVLCALIALVVSLGGFDFFDLILTGLGVLVLSFQFYASLHSEKLIELKDYNGFLLGLLLSLFVLPGFSLPLGLFGLYVFLNQDFRRNHLPSALPEWLYNLLIKLDDLVQKVPGTFWTFGKNFQSDRK